MTHFVKVARVEDIPPGERLWFEFEEETIVIFNIDGRFYAIADLCTHDGGPLEDGALDGFTVACPRHGATFDVRTGAALTMPATTAVPSYAVKIEDGYVCVESPDAW